MTEELKIQGEHLANWAAKLKPEIAQGVTEYVLSTNRPDRVFRGQDIIEIIRQWPDVQFPYPPINDV